MNKGWGGQINCMKKEGWGRWICCTMKGRGRSICRANRIQCEQQVYVWKSPPSKVFWPKDLKKKTCFRASLQHQVDGRKTGLKSSYLWTSVQDAFWTPWVEMFKHIWPAQAWGRPYVPPPPGFLPLLVELVEEAAHSDVRESVVPKTGPEYDVNKLLMSPNPFTHNGVHLPPRFSIIQSRAVDSSSIKSFPLAALAQRRGC